MQRGNGATPTARDVARKAGVTVGMVSTVLNRPDLVPDQTVERVLAAIDDLGFAPENAARQLRPGDSRAVGLIIIDTTNPFFTSLARGAEDAVSAHGDLILLGNTDGQVGREHGYVDLFGRLHARGVLINPTHHAPPDPAQLERLGIPVVFLDRHDLGDTYTAVYVDGIEGGRLAGRHLVELGHRHVWYAGGPMSLQQVRDRLEGLREVISAAGGSVHFAATQGLTFVDGLDAASRFDPAEPTAPTAVFAVNDLVALGILAGLLGRGVRVPQDVSIVGYDDIDVVATATVPLTTVHQPAYELGRRGANLMYARLSGEDGATGARLNLPCHLVVRDSTAPPRG